MTDHAPASPMPDARQLLPATPPVPIYAGELPLQELLEHLEPYESLAPTKNFLRSVRTWGVREPIILTARAAPNAAGMRYCLRAGRRRLAAARQLGLEKIGVIIYGEDVSTLAALALEIDSNIQRSANPLSELGAILDFMTEATARGIQVGERDIHYATGMPVQTIRKRLKLTRLPQAILTAVTEKRVTLHLAEAIARLPPPRINEMAELLSIQGKLQHADLRRVRQAARQAAATQIESDTFATPDAGHQHQFKFAWPHDHTDIFYKCDCGLKLINEQIVELLNRSQ